MILFTADWHIKLGQKNIPREWAKARYRELFKQIHNIVCDQHIVGGDIFDRLPTIEELELYFEFVASVQVPTIIYDGNHEATRKHQTFLTHLTEATKKINPLVEVCTELTDYGSFYILPYADLHKKGKIEEIPDGKIVFTHVRGEIPPHVKPEVDLGRFARFPIVYAGDLHSHSNSQRNIVYPGSPLTTSFHRSEVKTGYILIDDTDWTWHEFKLPQLLRKTVTSKDEIVPSEYHHTIYEIEGDLQALSSVENSELLDKKIVKRQTECTLVLDKNMSIEDELYEYLAYILELEKPESIMETYYDYI